MSAVLHVRCPVCPEVIDSVIETETWGSTIPGDHGCGNVTLHGSAMTNHISSAHSREEVLRAVADHHRSAADYHARWVANFDR